MSFPQDLPAPELRKPATRERISPSRDAAEAILREIRSLKAQLASVARSNRLLSKRDAAKYLGVSRGRTLDALIAADSELSESEGVSKFRSMKLNAYHGRVNPPRQINFEKNPGTAAMTFRVNSISL